MLEFVRETCLALPDTAEKVSWGEPVWHHRKGKIFAMFADRHHNDRVSVWIAARPGVQEALIQESPEQYFRPPYVGVKGWVGAYLDVEFDRVEVAELLSEGHALTAPKPGRKS